MRLLFALCVLGLVLATEPLSLGQKQDILLYTHRALADYGWSPVDPHERLAFDNARAIIAHRVCMELIGSDVCAPPKLQLPPTDCTPQRVDALIQERLEELDDRIAMVLMQRAFGRDPCMWHHFECAR